MFMNMNTTNDDITIAARAFTMSCSIILRKTTTLYLPYTTNKPDYGENKPSNTGWGLLR